MEELHNETISRRKVLSSVGGVACAAVTAGCSGSDNASFTIKDVSIKRIEQTNDLQVSMRVRYTGDSAGKFWGHVRLERDSELIGEKRQRLQAIPTSSSGMRGTFLPLEPDVPLSEYTASGTIPGHDWVTARDD